MTLLLPAFVGAPQVNRVYQVDALTLLRAMPDKSVDAIITDLPYQTTQNIWDEIIPFVPMWVETKRVLRQGGVFVTTASQPFTSKLVCSNLPMFRYEWIWVKSQATGFLDAPRKPMKQHESILVFSEQRAPYYPQMTKGAPYVSGMNGGSTNYGYFKRVQTVNDGERYPKSVIEFNIEKGLHPTQKPIGLYEYLIRTYTQPSDLVVDFCCGSGTTAVAARNLGRQWIACDTSDNYVKMARKRLAMPFTPLMFPEHYAAPQAEQLEASLS